MSTAVIWSKLKPEVELQYVGHLGEFNGMSCQSYVSHYRVLPLGELTVMIQEPRITLQGAVTWRNQCHDRATLQGVRIPYAILKFVSRHIVFFCFLNAVWALTSGGFRIVSDTLVWHKTSLVSLCLVFVLFVDFSVTCCTVECVTSAKAELCCLSVCPSFCMSVCQFACLSVWLYVRLSVCLSLSLFVRLFVCLSVSLSF